MRDQVSLSYKTTGKIIVLYILVFKFLVAKWKTKDSAPNDSRHFLNSICSKFLPEWNFVLLSLFPNIRSLAPFKGTIINLYTVTSACILISRYDHVLCIISINF